MIGRNPLNASYYNPLGRSAKSWTDDKKRVVAIEQLKAVLDKLQQEGKGDSDEALETASRMRRLGVSDKEIGVAVASS
jgi:hypothetical protein